MAVVNFNWLTFVKQRGIHYAERGPNVYRNHIAIKCPFCGNADPSEHMGLALDTAAWGCLRNREHRGHSPAYLVAKLLSCSPEEARRITGQEAFYVPEDFMAKVGALLDPPPAVKASEAPVLYLMPEFRPFSILPPRTRLDRAFSDYMEGRGFTKRQCVEAGMYFKLYTALRGPFRYRMIFPVHFEGKLVTWTGRDITGQARLRYKALSVDPEQAAKDGTPVALRRTTDCLLWFDELSTVDADTLVLCEGPMDALKVWLLGHHRGIVATCFFTAAPSDTQIGLLHAISSRYRRRLLILDSEAVPQAIRVGSDLAALRFEPKSLPGGIEDPALLKSLDFLSA